MDDRFYISQLPKGQCLPILSTTLYLPSLDPIARGRYTFSNERYFQVSGKRRRPRRKFGWVECSVLVPFWSLIFLVWRSRLALRPGSHVKIGNKGSRQSLRWPQWWLTYCSLTDWTAERRGEASSLLSDHLIIAFQSSPLNAETRRAFGGLPWGPARFTLRTVCKANRWLWGKS